MINIHADELFYVSDCSVGISTITFENCYFANCTFDDYGGILYNDEDFCEIGKAFEKNGTCRKGKAGNADCRLMNQRELVDFAKDWMERNRN